MTREKEAIMETRPSLPANLTFVVQFRADAEGEQERFAGRVEHVVSGASAHFGSLDALLTFMTQVLQATRDDNERSGQASSVDTQRRVER